MADDVNVKQSALLHAYAGKMNDFRDVTIAGSMVIHRQAGKFIDQNKELLHQIEGEVRFASEMAEKVISRYEYVFEHELSDDPRDVIGKSDEEVQKKMEKIQTAFEELKKILRSIDTKLENVRERTKTYGSQMNEMCERSSSMLKQRADLIDQYKNRK